MFRRDLTLFVHIKNSRSNVKTLQTTIYIFGSLLSLMMESYLDICQHKIFSMNE